MYLWSWRRRRADRQLSEFLDGELAPQQAAAVGERLVFDRRYRDRLAGYQRVAELVSAALAAPPVPEPGPLAARLAVQAAHRPWTAARRGRPARPWVRPAAVIASVGLLLTAGVALARLRRRGRI